MLYCKKNIQRLSFRKKAVTPMAKLAIELFNGAQKDIVPLIPFRFVRGARATLVEL
jgi:hypothetical protein